MAEQDVERTEEPTPRRRREARREGQIAVSTDVNITVNLLAVVVALMWAGQGAPALLRSLFPRLWTPPSELDLASALRLLYTAGEAALHFMWPVLVAALASGVIAGLGQTRGALTLPRAKPKLSKINPAQNFSRIIKRDALMELLKSVLKIAIAAGAIWFVISDRIDEYLGLPGLPLYLSSAFQLRMLLEALLAGAVALILVAAIDYAWQYYQTEKRMKMTRSEVKDEMKQNQGDPQVRAKQLSNMMERSLRRMMQEVPGADVVITNPEHISIALKYRRSEMSAPQVVARGAGFVALRIREIAREAGVPIVEDRPVARALYRAVRVGQQVPERLFQAVAEILAYVYRLDRRRGAGW